MSTRQCKKVQGSAKWDGIARAAAAILSIVSLPNYPSTTAAGARSRISSGAARFRTFFPLSASLTRRICSVWECLGIMSQKRSSNHFPSLQTNSNSWNLLKSRQGAVSVQPSKIIQWDSWTQLLEENKINTFWLARMEGNTWKEQSSRRPNPIEWLGATWSTFIGGCCPLEEEVRDWASSTITTREHPAPSLLQNLFLKSFTLFLGSDNINLRCFPNYTEWREMKTCMRWSLIVLLLTDRPTVSCREADQWLC